jgi:hypothetical protein
MGKRLCLAVCVCALTGACSTIREELPSQTDSSEALADGSLIPDAPNPTPTPTPEVPPLPADPGGGGGSGVLIGFCGGPAPPSISRVKVAVLNTQPARRVLNATPLVGPDEAYCRLIGYTDGRLFCPVRPEGHPEREACEALQVGRATDTGRAGPTWTADGRPCLGRTGGASCQNHPDNQFLVIAFGTGIFEACTASGTCGRYAAP